MTEAILPKYSLNYRPHSAPTPDEDFGAESSLTDYDLDSYILSCLSEMSASTAGTPYTPEETSTQWHSDFDSSFFDQSDSQDQSLFHQSRSRVEMEPEPPPPPPHQHEEGEEWNQGPTPLEGKRKTGKKKRSKKTTRFKDEVEQLEERQAEDVETMEHQIVEPIIMKAKKPKAMTSRASKAPPRKTSKVRRQSSWESASTDCSTDTTEALLRKQYVLVFNIT